MVSKPVRFNRSRRRGRSRPTIGLLTAWLRDPYATVTWSGVMDAARERDVNVVNLVGSRLRSPFEFESASQVLFDLVDPDVLDGLVVFSEMLYHFVSVTDISRFVDRYRPVPMTSIGVVEGIPSVMLDIEQGMREMTAHLVDVHGYQRMAYLSGPAGEQTAEAMFRGFQSALNACDIAFEPALVTPRPPSWGAAIAADGIRVLLDERKLVPGKDFECLVGCGDREIIAAAEILQDRGFRIPNDIAVTGYNSLEEARLAVPSITTVDRKIAELARRATDMLLDMLDGKQVPDRLILPPELVVRRSCGCMPQMVIQAAADPAVAVEVTPTPADLARLRASVAAGMVRSWPARIPGSTAGFDSKWADHLFTSFLAELEGESPGVFLTTLEDMLRQVLATDGNVSAWHSVLSTLRKQVRPHLGSPRLLAQCENLWQQARVMIGDFAEQAQGRRHLLARQQVRTLSDISQALITTFDMKGLMDVLTRDLPQLGIPACYLSLYEDASQPAAAARLILAYNDAGRARLELDGQSFPSRFLVPAEMLGDDRRRDLLVLALHFQGEQLGFVVMEMGPRDGSLYEALRIQISSALKGALLARHNVELYQEAVAARKMAEDADQLKSRFLSTVSHELRTPLSLIVGTIEMILRDGEATSQKLPVLYQRDLESIRISAQHLARLIGDVLDLASSQAGQLRLQLEPLRLREVLDKVVMLGEPLAREKGLIWRTNIPDDLPVVWGDRTRLQQVALNLVANAVKFTDDGSVSLWVEVGRDQVVVAVTDTGIGISAAEHQFIFDEFRQSERAAKRGYGGMGLGLAISRRLVEMHGGQAGVLSTGGDGAGSTFYFTLPVMPDPALALEAPNDREHLVLLLTERAGAGNRVHDHLLARGFEVECLATVNQADWLERIVAAPPGAVVLDFEPAAEQGWELMQVLRQNPLTQGIPVVFFALSDDQDQGTALTVDYLIKPVGNVEMARALERQGLGPEICDQSRTILLVDDDPSILDLHERVLKGLAPECHIIRAPGGRQALQQMERKTPDLVLLDLMMPEIDGFAVLEAMRDRPQTREVPVIVVTAQVLSGQDMARLQRGVAAVLGKGLFSGAEVLAQVEAALRRSKRLGNEVQRVVRQTMANIHEHYAEPLSREELAGRVGLSDRYLTRCFRQETGVTPITYLNRYRIRQARMLLERDELSVTEVAFATGFSDSNYFGRVFRAEVGVSPRAYQRGERILGR